MSTKDISPRKPSLALALTPVILTLLLLALQLFYFGDFTPQIPLAIGLAICLCSHCYRYDHWRYDSALDTWVIRKKTPV